MPIQRRIWISTVIAASAITAGSIAIALAHNASAASDVLLSQGRAATASSTEVTGLEAGKSFDGKTSTRWGSLEGVDPQWIQVDLGAVKRITRVTLTWETAYGKAYSIETSTDATNWTTVYATTKGDGGTDRITGLTGAGRYVRLLGTARGTQWGYSLWEMRVYGNPGEGAASPPASSAASGAAQPTAGPTASSPAASAPPSKAGNPTQTSSGGASGADLTDQRKKDIAMQLVSSAENSSLDWKAQYRYIEDIGDGRGYTAGIIGFCSGTGDMLEVVDKYAKSTPGNVLAKYLPALRQVDGTASHSGLDPNFTTDWRTAAADPAFQRAQESIRDDVYFNPAVNQARSDGLRALGQFIYYDAIVMHGPGSDSVSFGGIRKAAMARAKTPAQGGSEVAYLSAFLDARVAAMRTEEAHSDTSRVDTAQRAFLNNGNLTLATPLTWKVYGDSFTIK